MLLEHIKIKDEVRIFDCGDFLGFCETGHLEVPANTFGTGLVNSMPLTHSCIVKLNLSDHLVQATSSRPHKGP